MSTESAPQTLTGLIRSRIPEYQARQLAGVSQKTFAEELTRAGRPVSYTAFRVLYARARKQLRLAAASPVIMASPAVAPIDRPPPDPITPPKGTSFQFKGTNGFDPDDLI